MNIFILGATGFIGNAIFHSLVSDHSVKIGSRTPIDGYSNWQYVDFLKENNWDEILEDIDLVINAIGIIEGDFEKVQTKAPRQLFEVCIRKKIKIIHISAIGAEKENPPIPFLQSKKITDDFLLKYENSRVIYPGIVLGNGGESSQFFAEMAQFPIIPILKLDSIPAIHISQLTEIVKDVVDRFDELPKQIFTISKPESLEKIITAIRGKKTIFLNMPILLLKFLFSIFPKMTIGIFNKNMLTMLSFISANDYTPCCEEASFKINPKNTTKSSYFPMIFALMSVSFIWLWSGISSLISWDESNRLMREIGANDMYATLFIYLGSFADIILGLWILGKKHRKKVLVFQILFIVTYSLILTVLAPYYWLHPLGVLSKNIPLIALSFYMYQKIENK